MSRCKLRTVYSEAPFEDKREPDADCEQSERCLTDPEPDMEMRQAHFRNMRSKCRCSCVLQFTRHLGVSSVLHRPLSQIIHCIVLYLGFQTCEGLSAEHRVRSANSRQLDNPSRGRSQLRAVGGRCYSPGPTMSHSQIARPTNLSAGQI